FIQKNYKFYEGDESFLVGVTEKTKKVWNECEELIIKEMKEGIIDVATDRVSGIDNYEPGYIDKNNEVIVGLQTDAPLRRIVNP
ncbi:pyruvate formate lyase family protein, partial [Escherichia coli]